MVETDPGIIPVTTTRIGKFILLLGPPFTGKTWAAMTFPNPIIANFDNKIPAPHPNLTNVKEVPFHSDAFCDKIIRPANPNVEFRNRRDVFLAWLGKFAPRLPDNCTFIVDSLGRVDDWWRIQTVKIEGMSETRGGGGGGLAYNEKIKYFTNVFSFLQTVPGTVIVTCHTQPEYNSAGQPTGRVKPLLSGQFAEKLAGYCTDAFRSYTKDNKYYWQIKPDAIADTNTALQTNTKSILATYDEFQKLIADPSYTGLTPVQRPPNAP